MCSGKCHATGIGAPLSCSSWLTHFMVNGFLKVMLWTGNMQSVLKVALKGVAYRSPLLFQRPLTWFAQQHTCRSGAS